MKISKIKPLTKEQLIISVDRLTRFKDTEVKYLRVFYDILLSNLLEPRYKKTELEKFDYSEITSGAEKIINYSLQVIGYPASGDYTVNERIFDYEKSVFHIDDNTAVLLNNKINFDGFINLLSETEEAPKNLQWLKYLKSNENITKIRYEKALKYPVEKLVIVEGATEETLLPVFAAKCGCDFDKNGVYVYSAGGKNQVVKSYYSFAEKLKIPIFVLLDKDAKQNQEYIEHKLRTQDVIHLLSCGEFEDLLPLQLIKRTLEYELSNISILEQDMLISDEPMVKRLEEIFKTRGMHEFKKVEFAQMVSRNILQDTDISEEIREIIHGIRDLK